MAVRIPDLDTALRLIGRQPEWRRFRQLARHTLENFPQLEEWLYGHPHKVLAQQRDWSTLLGFMAWLQRHPRPGIYLRQVDLPGLHTKFIETHRRLLMTLLAHRPLWGEEPKPTRRTLSRLRPEEARLYSRLQQDHYQPRLRLEQERIGYEWVKTAVARTLGPD